MRAREININVYGRIRGRSSTMYQILGGNDPIQYINHIFSRKKAVRKLLKHGLHFNDTLAIKGPVQNEQEVKQFTESLRLHLQKKNPLNLKIQGDTIPKNALELETQANHEQQKIINTSKSIIHRMSHFPWLTVLDIKPTDKTLEAKKIVTKIEDIWMRLRAIQIFSSFMLLVGGLGLLIMAGIVSATAPAQVPIVILVILIIMALLGASLLTGASLFGMRSGLFENKNQTEKLSEDFLSSVKWYPTAPISDTKEESLPENNPFINTSGTKPGGQT